MWGLDMDLSLINVWVYGKLNGIHNDSSRGQDFCFELLICHVLSETYTARLFIDIEVFRKNIGFHHAKHMLTLSSLSRCSNLTIFPRFGR